MMGLARAAMLANVPEDQAHGLLRPFAQDRPEQDNEEIALNWS